MSKDEAGRRQSMGKKQAAKTAACFLHKLAMKGGIPFCVQVAQKAFS